MFFALREIVSKRDLVWELALKDLKLRYARPALGFLWAFISPFLKMRLYFLKNWYNLWGQVIFVTVLALFLRLYSLGSCELWYDEIFSISIARWFWQNWNPPLYFMILHYWIKLFGTSEFVLRIPSMIFSVASIPCLFFLGKKIFNPRVGLWAALIMSLSAFHIWYAQEARPYSLSVLLSILTTYFLYRALVEKRPVFWFYFVLFSIFGIYCNINYFHFFLLASQVVFMAIFLKNEFWNKAVYLFPVLLVFLPRLSKMMEKFDYIRGGFWIPPASVKSLLITVENFNLGFNMPPFLYYFSDIWACLLLGASIILVRSNDSYKQGLNFLLILFVLPIIAIFFVSKILVPIYLDRGLIIFSPYYYLILALGFEGLFKTRIKAIFIVISFLLFVISIFGYYRNWMFTPVEHHIGAYLKKPLKPVIRFIEDHLEAGDIVMYTNSSLQEGIRFYSQKKEIAQYFLFAPGMIDTSWKRPYSLGPLNICVNDIDSVAVKRFWVISSNWPRDGGLDDNSSAVKRELDNKYKLDFSKELEGLWIFRYVR